MRKYKLIKNGYVYPKLFSANSAKGAKILFDEYIGVQTKFKAFWIRQS